MTETKTRIKLIALILVTVCGLILAIALANNFYEIRGGTAAFKSICNLSAGFNCDAVAGSRWAELFAGLPLASFAGGWYLGLILVALIALNRFWRREAVRAIFLMTLNGLIFSIIYFIVMKFVLHTLCLFCLLVDVVNVAAFGLALTLRPEWIKIQKPDWKKWRTIALVMLGSVAVTVLGLKLVLDEPLDSRTIENVANSVLTTPAVAVRNDGNLPFIGDADAPITITEFSDFQCPHCRHGALLTNSLLNLYHGKVRIVFRNFPIDPACNRTISHGGHPAACESARAVVCAHEQGKFREVFEHLFDQQLALRPGNVAAMAKEVGVDEARLLTCMPSPTTDQAIARDIEDAGLLGVNATPTFFINGHKMEGVTPIPVWAKIIDTLLAQQAR